MVYDNNNEERAHSPENLARNLKNRQNILAPTYSTILRSPNIRGTARSDRGGSVGNGGPHGKSASAMFCGMYVWPDIPNACTQLCIYFCKQTLLKKHTRNVKSSGTGTLFEGHTTAFHVTGHVLTAPSTIALTWLIGDDVSPGFDFGQLRKT